MSIRDFAAHLGISDRMVSKWEAKGTAIHPRPINQAALDTSLARSTADERARFELIRNVDATASRSSRAATVAPTPALRCSRHEVGGKAMVRVEAGVFLAGEANQPIWLPAFDIDVYPTTNADYGRFLSATGHKAPPHWAGRQFPSDIADHPVVFVTWHDAAAYASWAGKELPSAKQWEKAARGSRGERYPWGNALTPAKCNVRESGIGSTTPVDRYHSGTSLYGAYDMCGNVWEWCATETTSGRHELKGSAFTSSFAHAAPSAFNDASADMHDDDTGFRCIALASESEEVKP